MTDAPGWPTDAVSLAEELVRCLKLRAMTPENDGNPFKVTVLEAHVTQQWNYTIIYRQAASPQLLGRSGNAVELSAQFEPQQTADKLASILLQSMSEPSGDEWGSPPKDWPQIVTEVPLTRIRWVS